VRRKTRGIVSLSIIEEEPANCKSLINAMPDYLGDPASSNGAHRGRCLQQREPEMVRVPNTEIWKKNGGSNLMRSVGESVFLITQSLKSYRILVVRTKQSRFPYLKSCTKEV
jgi:hypothetical protein